MNELAFGTASPPHEVLPGDQRFMNLRRQFAYGEVLVAGGPEWMAAYRAVRGHRFAEAIALYDGILRDTPDRPHIWVNRGVALQATGDLVGAIASYEQALELKPDYAAGLINRGVVRGWLCGNAAALADYDRAVELEPDNEAARLGRSVILSQMGEFARALEDTEHVLERNPGSGAGHYNKALILLSLGDYLEGFREHEWRFGTQSILGMDQNPEPRWLGGQTDKTILVHCEQGLGDAIQFLRYLPLMRARGLRIVLHAPPALRALVRSQVWCDFPVGGPEDSLPEHQLHVPIISLAALFRTELDSVPARGGYLLAHPRLIEDWGCWLAGALGSGESQYRVGLCWSSGVRKGQVIAEAMQRRKTVPTEVMGKITEVRGPFRFVSLQKDEPLDGNIMAGVVDPMPEVKDLADTAAIIAHLDLVISVDSAVAHLAAAMGKRVWVLNRADICWRWLSGETLSPWYETARVYRQREPMIWDEVVEEVRRHLMKETIGYEHCRAPSPR